MAPFFYRCVVDSTNWEESPLLLIHKFLMLFAASDGHADAEHSFLRLFWQKLIAQLAFCNI